MSPTRFASQPPDISLYLLNDVTVEFDAVMTPFGFLYAWDCAGTMKSLGESSSSPAGKLYLRERATNSWPGLRRRGPVASVVTSDSQGENKQSHPRPRSLDPVPKHRHCKLTASLICEEGREKEAHVTVGGDTEELGGDGLAADPPSQLQTGAFTQAGGAYSQLKHVRLSLPASSPGAKFLSDLFPFFFFFLPILFKITEIKSCHQICVICHVKGFWAFPDQTSRIEDQIK